MVWLKIQKYLVNSLSWASLGFWPLSLVLTSLTIHSISRLDFQLIKSLVMVKTTKTWICSGFVHCSGSTKKASRELHANPHHSEGKGASIGPQPKLSSLFWNFPGMNQWFCFLEVSLTFQGNSGVEGDDWEGSCMAFNAIWSFCYRRSTWKWVVTTWGPSMPMRWGQLSRRQVRTCAGVLMANSYSHCHGYIWSSLAIS